MKTRHRLTFVLIFLGLLDSAVPRTVPHRFSIQYDYRFAGSCVASPEARRTLDAVAALYGRLITDDFPSVPAGTVISVWNEPAQKYEEAVLAEPVDDVIAFVFCAEWPGSGTKATAAPVGSPVWKAGTLWERRWTQKPFQPWAIRININSSAGRPWFYDPTPESGDDLPSRTHYDLFQSLLHEMGHGLGLIRNESPFVFTDLVKGDLFYGPNAMKWNEGKPVPLEKGSSHIQYGFNRGLLRPNLDRYMMHGTDVIQGFRAYPHALDLAMLKDIGYRIDPAEEARVLSLSAAGLEDPRKAAYRAIHGESESNPQLPVGLWYFDDARFAGAGIVGRPLRYMPPAAFPSSHKLPVEEGAVLLPRGSFLIADHGMRGNGGGREVNQYSIVMDIRLPRTGQNYGLYNTSYQNAEGNAAEAFIDTRDRLGQGNYSQFTFRARQWYRVTLTVDNAANERKYYVDGNAVLTQAAGERDGRFSIGAVDGDHTPLLCFFADGNNDRDDILVRSVALYSYVLAPDRVKQLGKSGEVLH